MTIDTQKLRESSATERFTLDDIQGLVDHIDAQADEIEALRSHNALLRGSIAQIEREADRLRQALDGLLNALPSATTHPAIQAARAALSQEPT